MKRMRFVVYGLLLFASLVGIVRLTFWSPGAITFDQPEVSNVQLPLRFRNWEEHDRIVTEKPYVLKLDTKHGSLLYYGAHHFKNADNPQIHEIEKEWQNFHPTVALCEGRSRGYLILRPLERFVGTSDPAVVHRLARRDNVPLYSLEPSYKTEVQLLLKKWTPQQIAAYFTFRVYWNEAGGKANDSLALDLLKKRTNVEGLRGSLSSLQDLDRLWNRDLKQLGNWRTRKEMPQTTYLWQIDEESREIRGQHMARLLIHLVKSGERVFAVVGSGHVIRQEWTLRAAIDAPPAADQPRVSF